MDPAEGTISTVSVSVGITFLCVVLAYIWGTWPYKKLKSIGIPGPKPTAFLGNIPDIKKKGTFNLDLELQEKYGEVVSFYTGRYPGIIVYDPEMLKQIMVKDFSAFTNRPKYLTRDETDRATVLHARDHKWKHLRTVLSPNFSTKKMKEMVPLVHSALINLEKNCEAKAKSGEDVDINALFGGYTMDVIATTAFGIEVDSQEDPDNIFVKRAREIFAIDQFRFIFLLSLIINPLFKLLTYIPFLYKNLTAPKRFFINFCTLLLSDRKEKKYRERNDLLQLMINSQEKSQDASEETNGVVNGEQESTKQKIKGLQQKKLTDQDIEAQCFIFFLAGYETSSSTLAFLAHSLSLNPDIQEKLHREIKEILADEVPNYDNIQKLPYLEQCISETLRKYPIATRVLRDTSRDVTIKNWLIPKDTAVIIPIYALHHNPEYWPDPQRFDPDRFTPEAREKHTPFTYLPFGGGPRICIGMRLAQLELKMSMVTILRKFKFVPCEKTDNPIEFLVSPILSPKNRITLKIERLQTRPA